MASFNSIPTELRLSIWNLCLPGPRYIELLEDSLHEGGPAHLSTTEVVPKIFLICHEARTEVLNKYTLVKCRDPHLRGYLNPAVYIDFTVDFIIAGYRCGPLELNIFARCYGARIERLIVNGHKIGLFRAPGNHTPMPMIEWAGYLPNLKMLMLGRDLIRTSEPTVEEEVTTHTEVNLNQDIVIEDFDEDMNFATKGRINRMKAFFADAQDKDPTRTVPFFKVVVF